MSTEQLLPPLNYALHRVRANFGPQVTKCLGWARVEHLWMTSFDSDVADCREELEKMDR
jgi:hypothetical protein